MTDNDNPACTAAATAELAPGAEVVATPEGDKGPRTELNAEEASILVEAAAEVPVTPIEPEPVDPFVIQATRLLGPNYAQIEQGAAQAGLDFKGYVLATCAKLNDMEAEQELLAGDFQRSLAPELWPCVESALSVNHTIENCRRGLMGLIDSGSLVDQPAQAVAELFTNLSGATNMFVNATITSLLGQVVAGFDEATVKRLILEPFNGIMEQKRRIFDFVGEANFNFASSIMRTFAEQAAAAGEKAAAEAPEAAPSLH